MWRDMAGGTAADPGFVWSLGVGIVLLALGVLGFVPNPLVGAPSAAWGSPLLLTGDAHDVLHLVGGAVALHAALGMSRARRDVVLIGLGSVGLVLLALGLLDGRWFGVAPYPVGLADQLLHLVVGLGSLVMGLAGTGTIVVPVVTGAYRRSELGLPAGAAATAEPEADAGAAATAEPEADAGAAATAEPEAAPTLELGLETSTGPITGPDPASETVAEPGPEPDVSAETATVAEPGPEPDVSAETATVAESAPDPTPPEGPSATP
jgi:hypothetical protein